MTFDDLGLAEPILRAVTTEGYTTPTPIQCEAIPHVRDGRDLLGCAQTGTGKTAAFALPIIHRLTSEGNPRKGQGRRIRVLVLSPTRELASQIGDSFQTYGRHTALRLSVVFGGVNQNPQTLALRKGVDILVATPGRLLDLMNQGYIDLSSVEIFVLDEADRMLDMGFLPDIRRVIGELPEERQTLLFSATMPPDIRQLADKILRDPVHVQITPVAATVDLIEQAVYFVEKKNKPELLRFLLQGEAITRALVFTRTKHGADRVVRHLSRAGIRAEAIHGDKTQAMRQRALFNFKSGKVSILVATDIAARGIDVDSVSHVLNYDLPHEAETYVHRIGRTGRAGATGKAVSFCDWEERKHLKGIERLLRITLPIMKEQPVYAAQPTLPASAEQEPAGADGATTPDRPPRAAHASKRGSEQRGPSYAGQGAHRPAGAGRSGGNRGGKGRKPNRFGGGKKPART
jgi:ATP-dependent RNA helicase RhlE